MRCPGFVDPVSVRALLLCVVWFVLYVVGFFVCVAFMLFLLSLLCWFDLVVILPLLYERFLVFIFRLHSMSILFAFVPVLILHRLVELTTDL